MTSVAGVTRLVPIEQALPAQITATLTVPMTSDQIAKSLGRSKQAVTDELRRMLDAGAVTVRMDRQRKLYEPAAVLGGAAPL
jgi:IS30 family transposase